jgi:hypothetical protein
MKIIVHFKIRKGMTRRWRWATPASVTQTAHNVQLTRKRHIGNLSVLLCLFLFIIVIAKPLPGSPKSNCFLGKGGAATWGQDTPTGCVYRIRRATTMWQSQPIKRVRRSLPCRNDAPLRCDDGYAFCGYSLISLLKTDSDVGFLRLCLCFVKSLFSFVWPFWLKNGNVIANRIKAPFGKGEILSKSAIWVTESIHRRAVGGHECPTTEGLYQLTERQRDTFW